MHSWTMTKSLIGVGFENILIKTRAIKESKSLHIHMQTQHPIMAHT